MWFLFKDSELLRTRATWWEVGMPAINVLAVGPLEVQGSELKVGFSNLLDENISDATLGYYLTT